MKISTYLLILTLVFIESVLSEIFDEDVDRNVDFEPQIQVVNTQFERTTSKKTKDIRFRPNEDESDSDNTNSSQDSEISEELEDLAEPTSILPSLTIKLPIEPINPNSTTNLASNSSSSSQLKPTLSANTSMHLPNGTSPNVTLPLNSTNVVPNIANTTVCPIRDQLCDKENVYWCVGSHVVFCKNYRWQFHECTAGTTCIKDDATHAFCEIPSPEPVPYCY